MVFRFLRLYRPKLNRLFDVIKDSDIADSAQALRPEHRYTAAHLPETASELAAGGMNVHVPITFDDGVKWLARIRKPHFHGPPSDMMKVVVVR